MTWTIALVTIAALISLPMVIILLAVIALVVWGLRKADEEARAEDKRSRGAAAIRVFVDDALAASAATNLRHPIVREALRSSRLPR